MMSEESVGDQGFFGPAGPWKVAVATALAALVPILCLALVDESNQTTFIALSILVAVPIVAQKRESARGNRRDRARSATATTGSSRAQTKQVDQKTSTNGSATTTTSTSTRATQPTRPSTTSPSRPTASPGSTCVSLPLRTIATGWTRPSGPWRAPALRESQGGPGRCCPRRVRPPWRTGRRPPGVGRRGGF